MPHYGDGISSPLVIGRNAQPEMHLPKSHLDNGYAGVGGQVGNVTLNAKYHMTALCGGRRGECGPEDASRCESEEEQIR